MSFLKNTAGQSLIFDMLDFDGEGKPGAAGNLSGVFSLDGAAFAALGGTITEVAGTTGTYKLPLSQAETNGEVGYYKIVDSGGALTMSDRIVFTDPSAGGGPTAAQIADAVLDEILADHVTAGSTGKALTDILADTNELQVDWVNGGRLDLLIDAIKTVTDVLPDNGALTVLLSNIVDILVDTNETQGKLPTNNIMGSAVKTDKDDEIDAIKASTDNLPSDPASEANVDANETKIDIINTISSAMQLIIDLLPDSGALTTIITDLNNIKTRIPTALVGGRMDSDVGNMQNDVIDSDALATDAFGALELSTGAVNKIRDSILSDATPFPGANINKPMSSLSSHTPTDVNNKLTSAHGQGQWDGAGAIQSEDNTSNIVTNSTPEIENSGIITLPSDEVAFARTNIRDRILIVSFDNPDDWTAKNTDTDNIVLNTKHVIGTKSIGFDKVDTGADDVEAVIENNFSKIDASRMLPCSEIFSMLYLSSLTNIVNVFIRIGADSNNYNQWTFPSKGLIAKKWNRLRKKIEESDYIDAGSGWDQSNILYVAVGVTFEDEANTLAGITIGDLNLIDCSCNEIKI